MRYVYWIIEKRLCGRPGPDEVPWDLLHLKAAGISTILSLHDAGTWMDTIEQCGFTHKTCFLPVSYVPELSTLNQQITTCRLFIKEQLTQGKTVLVHCHAGRDRTGIVLADFLVKVHGLSFSDALSRLRMTNSNILTSQMWLDAAFAIFKQQ